MNVTPLTPDDVRKMLPIGTLVRIENSQPSSLTGVVLRVESIDAKALRFRGRDSRLMIPILFSGLHDYRAIRGGLERMLGESTGWTVRYMIVTE